MDFGRGCNSLVGGIGCSPFCLSVTGKDTPAQEKTASLNLGSALINVIIFFCLTEEFKFFFVFWADKLSPYNETLPDRDGIDGVSYTTFPKTENEPLKIPVDLV